MSFLRAFIGELPSTTKSTTNQGLHSGSGSSSSTQQQNQQQRMRQEQNHNPTTPTSGGNRRHHAKALLHPMSLLLRRRSGQTNNNNTSDTLGGSYQLVSSKYGSSRELPADFDAGIIYGTRHPDWTFPRRSAVPPVGNTLDNNIQSKSPPITGDETPIQLNDSQSISSHARARQAYFTEHFGDIETAQKLPNQNPETFEDQKADPNIDNQQQLISPHDEAIHTPELWERRQSYSPGSDVYANTVGNTALLHNSSYESKNEPSDQNILSPTDTFVPQGSILGQTGASSTTSLDQLDNASRFSFEASSTADSIHNEELTLSEGVGAKKPQYQTHHENGGDAAYSDDGSFRSDDIQSIRSEDLLDEDDDGFITSPVHPGYLHSIPPPPGFEHLVVVSPTNTPWQQDQILLDEPELDLSPVAPHVDVTSAASSERGTNGSSTEEEERGNPKTTEANYPPFVNPTGLNAYAKSNLAGQLVHKTSVESFNREFDKSSSLVFQNAFQTGTQGVSEYDAGSPSSFAAFQSPSIPNYGPAEFGHEGDEDDEDDMIAEANRDALASDNEGWYGQEFGFYPTSSTNSTYLAGGFFGIDLPKPGFVRNPSLTPISERSESSLRNSLSFANPGGLNSGGISAGPLSAALFAELANGSQIACDEATLNQLHILNTNRTREDSPNNPKLFTASSPTATQELNPQSGFIFPFNQIPSQNASQSTAALIDDPGSHHGSDTRTSYFHDTEMGWVMEKRKGGELVRRELVHGAV